MNITIIPQLHYLSTNDTEFHIDILPYLYFLGTMVLVEHILFIYLT